MVIIIQLLSVPQIATLYHKISINKIRFWQGRLCKAVITASSEYKNVGRMFGKTNLWCRKQVSQQCYFQILISISKVYPFIRNPLVKTNLAGWSMHSRKNSPTWYCLTWNLHNSTVVIPNICGTNIVLLQRFLLCLCGSWLILIST